VPQSKLDRQQSARAEFKQHRAEHSGAHKQQTDGPDRVLVNHIGVHDEAHDAAYVSIFKRAAPLITGRPPSLGGGLSPKGFHAFSGLARVASVESLLSPAR
jgi:hypothetical protein